MHETWQLIDHGRNDPVARRILATAASDAGLAPPEDPSVTSLFLTRLPDQCTEPQLSRRPPQNEPLGPEIRRRRRSLPLRLFKLFQSGSGRGGVDG